MMCDEGYIPLYNRRKNVILEDARLNDELALQSVQKKFIKLVVVAKH